VLLGAREVLAGRLTPGELLIFVAYVGSLYKPVRDLGKLSAKFSRAGVSAQRVAEILDTEPDIEDAPDALELAAPGRRDRLRGRQLRLRRRPAGAGQGLSLRIAAGERVALVGPRARASRRWWPAAAPVRAHSRPHPDRRHRHPPLHARQPAPRDRHRAAGQHAVRVSVRENIAYGRPDAPRSWSKPRRARPCARVHRRPAAGLRHRARRARRNLSGGQRQRLCLARALVKEPAVLVMDEPTASVDAGVGALIHEAVARVHRGRTLMVIAHDYADMARYDRVLVLRAAASSSRARTTRCCAARGAYLALVERRHAPDSPADPALLLPALAGHRAPDARSRWPGAGAALPRGLPQRRPAAAGRAGAGGIERIDLPPLGMDDGHTVVSRDGQQDVARAQPNAASSSPRRCSRTRPAVLLVELFPFGRKKFAGEILPMIRAARRQPGGPARWCAACATSWSMRARPAAPRRPRALADRPLLRRRARARRPRLRAPGRQLPPAPPLRTPVHYTGYVVPRARHAPPPVRTRGEHLLVSAGGGIVGEALFRTALAARPLLAEPLPLRIVAGPFLPEPQWQACSSRCGACPVSSWCAMCPTWWPRCGAPAPRSASVATTPRWTWWWPACRRWWCPTRPRARTSSAAAPQRWPRWARCSSCPAAKLSPAALAQPGQLLAFQPRAAALAWTAPRAAPRLLAGTLPHGRRPRTEPACRPTDPAAAGLGPPPAPGALLRARRRRRLGRRRLFALLDTTQHAGVPIDLAVIPQAMAPAGRRAVRASTPPRACWACTSTATPQQPRGRVAASASSARRAARRRSARPARRPRAPAAALFGCTAGPDLHAAVEPLRVHTPGLLAELGFRAVARPPWRAGPAGAARAAGRRRLVQAAAHCRRARPPAGPRWRRRWPRARPQPVGLMLHHAEMDAADLARCAPGCRPARPPASALAPMRELLGLQRADMPLHEHPLACQPARWARLAQPRRPGAAAGRLRTAARCRRRGERSAQRPDDDAGPRSPDRTACSASRWSLGISWEYSDERRLNFDLDARAPATPRHASTK
jgi:hypothetical protein